jgi:hypothetical protein
MTGVTKRFFLFGEEVFEYREHRRPCQHFLGDNEVDRLDLCDPFHDLIMGHLSTTRVELQLLKLLLDSPKLAIQPRFVRIESSLLACAM